jgi:acyl-CoA dehydrogenase
VLQLKTELNLPDVCLTGFETPLSEEERAVQETLHRFAKEVLRPMGTALDKMTAEQAIAPRSSFYSVFTEFAKLGVEIPCCSLRYPPRRRCAWNR